MRQVLAVAEPDDGDLVEVFQDIIALEAREHREDVENMRRALASSRCIGMAIGILMRGHGLPQDQAWELLRAASRNSNRKLRDVAEDVVLSGDLP